MHIVQLLFCGLHISLSVKVMPSLSTITIPVSADQIPKLKHMLYHIIMGFVNRVMNIV